MKVLIERRTASGPTVAVGDWWATAECRTVIVRLPFGAFVWNRPSAVLVERDGRTERVAIVDVTRIAQVALWTITLATFIALWRWPIR